MQKFKSIGVVHLLPLPGSPLAEYSFDEVLQRALHDASVIVEGGMDGLIVENFGDAPFLAGNVPPHVTAMMAVISSRIRQLYKNMFIGINVLRNDASSALAVAAAAAANFIRVNVHIGAAWTDQGLIQGDAYQTLLYRKQLGCHHIEIAADVLVKHAVPTGESQLEILLKDTHMRGRSNTLILTGSRTGEPTSVEHLAMSKKIVPNCHIWIGSGLTPDNCRQYVDLAEAGIVGSYLHENGDLTAPLCSIRVKRLMSALYD